MNDRVQVPCPYCGADRPSPWGEEEGWSAVRCGACALVYLSPRPRDEAIDEAAQLGQHAVESGTLDVVGAFSPKKVSGTTARLKMLWSGTQAPWERGASWLDIGAGFGELVKALSDLGANEVLGLEPCAPKVQKAKELGLTVEAGRLEDVRRGWDVVSFVNVLSHLPDPKATIAYFASFVRPGGEVLMVTGNGADCTRAEYPQALSLPDHVVFAGEAHARGVLEAAGLVVEKVLRFPTALPRPAWEGALEGLAAGVLRRRVGYSRTPFRSLWLRARRLG